MSLVVKSLTCSRGGRPAFAGVSLALAPGEVLLLRGPNGAGKTTLLRALAGLLPARAGSIALSGDGGTVGPGADGYEERVAWVGHLDGLKPQLTVAENLRFWAAVAGQGAPAVARGLAAFDLGPIAGRAVHACSAGQKRRAGLARLLLAPRTLWLLDEPTVGLDAASVARLGRVLAGHLGAGGMAVIATHVALDTGRTPRTLELGAGAPAPAPAGGDDPFLAGAWT